MDKDERRANALQAMDIVVQGLITGQWGITSGYIEQPIVAANVVEGHLRLFLNALHIYHDQATCAEYARRILELVRPFAEGAVDVSEDEMWETLTVPLLEQLGSDR